MSIQTSRKNKSSFLKSYRVKRWYYWLLIAGVASTLAGVMEYDTVGQDV